MKTDYIPFVEKLIELAILEDIGDGDHTSLASIPATARGRMQLLVKDTGILAGVEVAKMVFTRLDPFVGFDQKLQDGARIKPGDVAFFVEGSVVSLLQAERIVLNIMQRMSGVATQTAHYAERLKDLKTKVLDTRKTTPGMRVLDKMAVALGGGANHRMGLFDMILLKDNHIDFAGGVWPALHSVREYMAAKGLKLPVEIEVRTLEEIDEVFASGGVDRIMLDNFSVELTRQAVEKIRGIEAQISAGCSMQLHFHTPEASKPRSKPVEIESSGGITIDTLRDYGLAGVDFISVGALTHQIKSLDMSLKAI